MIETLDLRYHHLEELIHLQQQHQMVVVVELLSIKYIYIIDVHGVDLVEIIFLAINCLCTKQRQQVYLDTCFTVKNIEYKLAYMPLYF